MNRDGFKRAEGRKWGERGARARDGEESESEGGVGERAVHGVGLRAAAPALRHAERWRDEDHRVPAQKEHGKLASVGLRGARVAAAMGGGS